MEKNAEANNINKKRSVSPIAIVGIGCLAIIILSFVAFGIAFAVAGKMILSPMGQNFLKSTVEKSTGVKIDTAKEGNGISITDTKTGKKFEVGEGKIPKNFPKDFPLYPDAKPQGSATGGDTTASGHWLLLTTPDQIASVQAYYSKQLEIKGWTVNEANTVNDGSAITVKKDKLMGTVIISKDTKSNATSILITLQPTNEKNPEPQNVSEEGSEPITQPF